MKKKLMLLSIFLTTFLFAGPKEDFETAFKNYEKTKNEKEFKESLLKIQKAKDLSNELKINIYENLYALEKDINNRIPYLEEIVKLLPKNVHYKLLLALDYKIAKKETKSDLTYKSIVNGLKLEEKEEIDTLFSKLLFNSGFLNEAEKIAKDLMKSKNKLVQSESNKLLSLLEMKNKKFDKALEYILVSSKLTEGKDLETEYILLNLYLANNKLENAYDLLLKLARNTKDTSFYIEAILLAEKLKKDANSLVTEYKKGLKEEEKPLVNLKLSEIFLYNGLFDLAIKYANKALKEDKQNESYIVLIVSYYNKNDKKEVSKYLKEAKKLKVKGIEKLEQEINKLK